ncbi:MAG TPA: LPS assembly lipoprotein LptE [Chitinophagaceae bacterium]|nr:LPS assembly lipoprotein LptE [Chitinophagaceae bacterium]
MKIISNIKMLVTCSLLLVAFNYATCKYSTKDTSPIPPDVKTFRVNYLENKARYVNPQLSPTLTEKLKQKIIGQTRLRQINGDEAHYDISGYITDYSVTTTGISNQAAGTNRLNVSFHLIFKNTLDQKKDFEADLTNNYDFNAQKSLQEAETQYANDILKNLVDGIFNKIFSNW